MKYVRKLTNEEIKWLQEIDEKYKKYGLTINNRNKKKKLLKQFQDRQKWVQAQKRNKGITKSIKRDFSTAQRFLSMGNVKLANLYIKKANKKMITNKNTDIQNSVAKLIQFGATNKKGVKLTEKQITSKINTLVKNRLLKHHSFTIVESIKAKEGEYNAVFKALDEDYGKKISQIIFDGMKEAYEEMGGTFAANTSNQSDATKLFYLTVNTIGRATEKTAQSLWKAMNNKKKASKLEQEIINSL